jgi:hypothetical protein
MLTKELFEMTERIISNSNLGFFANLQYGLNNSILYKQYLSLINFDSSYICNQGFKLLCLAGKAVLVKSSYGLIPLVPYLFTRSNTINNLVLKTFSTATDNSTQSLPDLNLQDNFYYDYIYDTYYWYV